MAEKYYSILTNRGKELEAQSSATGKPVIIKDFVVGDGNGRAVKPDPALTTLVHEVYRAAISALQVSPDQANQFIAQLVLPAGGGGFVVREVGLLTDAGELYAVANCAAIEKPASGISVRLQFRLAVSETADIELKVATGDGLFLRQDANLRDVKDAAESRKNIGLKGAAVLDVGTAVNTVAAGDDHRIVNALQTENNLSDVVDKALSRGNLGLKTAAIADVTTSNIDTNGGRVLKVGDYGLTRAINVASGTNVVTFLASAPGSFYHFDSSTSYTNAPNFGSGWFDVYVTIHETTNYRTIIAVSSSGTMAYAAITNGSFSGWSYPFTTAGGSLSGNLQISTAAPIIQMSETDTGKQYYIIVDGSGFRINEDGPSGRAVLAYSSNSSKTTTTGQFVPADYGNFDNRYPVRDAISYVGLEADNPMVPYMRRISNNSLVYLASRDWVNGNFATPAWTIANFLQGGLRLASLGVATNGNNDNEFAYAPNGTVVTAVQQKTNYTAVQYRSLQYNIGGNWYTAWVA